MCCSTSRFPDEKSIIPIPFLHLFLFLLHQKENVHVNFHILPEKIHIGLLKMRYFPEDEASLAERIFRTKRTRTVRWPWHKVRRNWMRDLTYPRWPWKKQPSRRTYKENRCTEVSKQRGTTAGKRQHFVLCVQVPLVLEQFADSRQKSLLTGYTGWRRHKGENAEGTRPDVENIFFLVITVAIALAHLLQSARPVCIVSVCCQSC